MKRAPGLPPLVPRALRVLDLHRPAAPGRPPFLSAASGLVRSGGELYVVADDEQQLGRFPAASGRPGRLLRLFAGELPLPRKARKRHKADLEMLLRLPPLSGYRHGALLALGSGSTRRRRRGALVRLDGRGGARGAVEVVDATPLYERLQREFGELNLEGGWCDGPHLRLLQRGNQGKSRNAIIELDYPRLAASLSGEGVLPAMDPMRVAELDLGAVQGVPLGFTDACGLANGDWLFSAVAEATDDARRDGEFAGAAIGLATRQGRILWQRRLDPAHKVEGIDATLRAGRLRILCVTDADDASVPAQLLELRIDRAGREVGPTA